MRLAKPAALTALLAASVAGAGPLAEGLPAGALLTLETQNAAPAFERVSGLLTGVLGGEDGEGGETLQGFQAILADSLGREAALGVFSVGSGGGTFSPELLAVTRAGELSSEFFGSLLPRRPGARMGNYPFVRTGGLFAGQAGGLVYLSSDKTLLMNYLGRLSGGTAPRLGASATYTTPARTVGAQQLGLYLNFSATAKVVRGAFARLGLPRLLSPLVDALDTLGQYAAGFTTTATGLTARNAHVPNAAGKDRPLLRLLTSAADFRVQDVIPADAEGVVATACSPERGAYVARWLTRVDLLEPFGFLTDSQLADHLERSGRYLGGDCATVTLAGGTRAQLDATDPLASLRSSVSYQRVTDRAAAEAHLPEYAASVNAAIAGLVGSLEGLSVPRGAVPGTGSAAGAAAVDAVNSSLEELGDVLGRLRMVYGFRGDYLVTAYSEDALRAALTEGRPTLGGSPDFRAANLPLTGAAGWSYGRNLPDLSAADLTSAVGARGEDEEDGTLSRLTNVFADLINRYDGMTAGRAVQGGAVVGQATVRYRW